MARLSSTSLMLLLLGLLSTSLAAPSPEFDQEQQHKDASCDNGCFFGSFPGGSCTDDAACMCTQQKYRERYFCCMAQKCRPEVLFDSIQRQTLACETRKMEFTFDLKEVCGVNLTTESTVTEITLAPSTTGTRTVTPATATASPTTTDVATKSSSTGTSGAPASNTASEASPSATNSETTPSGSTLPTPNSASQAGAMFNGLVAAVVGSGMLLW